ncbi:MAG: glycosyltransferase family 9 protein, partial [Elusimicrobiota bacterium]
DILLTTPAVSVLKKTFPQATINFLVYPEYAAILEGNPDIDNIVRFPKCRPWTLPSLLRKNYDWAIDFLCSGASAWACLLSDAPVRIAYDNTYPALIHNVKLPRPKEAMYAATHRLKLLEGLFGLMEAPPSVTWPATPKPTIFPDERAIAHWQTQLARTGPLVMMSPQSLRATRRFSPQGFAWVARQLAQKHQARVLCLWGPGERPAAEAVVRLANDPKVNVAPEFTTIGNLAAALKSAKCLITNCNGARHVAVAMGTPTVTIHMSSDPIAWNPPNPEGTGFHPNHPIVRAEDLWCLACQRNTCPYDLECSSMIDPAKVLTATERLCGLGSFVFRPLNG